MHQALQATLTPATGVEAPTFMVDENTAAPRQPDTTGAVGEIRPGNTGLTDEDRESAIVRAGRAIEKHEGVWLATGCFAARGNADYARRLMEQLIAGRSAEQVARMVAAQKVRMTLEPGATKETP